MNNAIKLYYNELAAEYDRDRFDNSYGKYIDNQEKITLTRWLKHRQNRKAVDVGCGTGRFLEFSDYGVDISPKMIEVSRQKYPEKQLFVSSATNLPFENAFFDMATSFHVLMHLDKKMTAQILNEVHRTLENGGVFIFDIPSKHRRNLTNYKAENWHGANDFTLNELQEMIKDKWEIKQYQGIAFFPIHRIPKKVRSYFIRLDNWLCGSFLKKYASYLMFQLEKR